MKLPVKTIKKDDDIYPRPRVSQKTVETYADAILAGAQFPPIAVQTIGCNGTTETVVLDGLHRLEAHKQAGKTEIEVRYWKEETLDKAQHLEELRIESGRMNRQHGDRLSDSDLGFQCLRIVTDRPMDKLTGIQKELATKFGVSESLMSLLIGDEVTRRRQSRDALAYRLYLLGWTQDEIADVVGVDRSVVSKTVQNFNTKLLHSEHESGLSPETIAKNHKLDMPLLWAILLEGKDDSQRFKVFGKTEYGDEEPKLMDYWKFAERDPRLGIASYPGNLYGQEALNIIYRFSKQGDLMVDPMGGGGTIVDASLVLGRRCRAFDIDPQKSGREDIRQHDIREGYPKRAIGCDLIIIDPPYYKKKEADYGDFTKDRPTFINNMANLAKHSYETVKAGGYVALLYGQYIDYDDELLSILSYDLGKLFEQVGFRPILNIQSPLTFNNQWHGDAIEEAKQHQPWRILPVSKDWQVFKK